MGILLFLGLFPAVEIEHLLFQLRGPEKTKPSRHLYRLASAFLNQRP